MQVKGNLKFMLIINNMFNYDYYFIYHCLKCYSWFARKEFFYYFWRYIAF